MLAGLLAACTQGPGGGGIGLASGQDPDPATVDFPIFYIRHQIPEDQDDVTRVRPFVEDDDYSATLWKRDRASPGAPETELTARLRAAAAGADPEDRYDIKDLAVSPDGLKVAFAMRGPLDDVDDEDEPPTWNIWEYDIATDTLHRVITSDIIAEEGQDVAPVLSTRRPHPVLLDAPAPGQGHPARRGQGAVRSRDRSAQRIRLRAARDERRRHRHPPDHLQPEQRPVSARCCRTAACCSRAGIARRAATACTCTPRTPTAPTCSCTTARISHLTGTTDTATGQPTSIEFMRAREMSDGRLMVLTRERTDVDFGGNLTIIDANHFVENTQTLLASAGTPGPAQTPATLNDVRTIPGPSPGGRFNSGFPLWDGSSRILVSWSQCRLLDTVDPTRIVPCTPTRLADPNALTAPPLYSIWMFDPSQNTILPVMPPVEGVMVTEAVAAQPRTPLPAVILDKQPPLDLDADLVAEGAGLLSIRSVYDIMGVDQARTDQRHRHHHRQRFESRRLAQYAQRQARFVRIEKPVSIPDDDDIADPDNSAFGPTGVMREIVAYAPVEPDGSVRMKVPANIAFQISLLDANGRRVSPPHRSWLQVRPGEVLECNGCHVRNAATTTRRRWFTAARACSIPRMPARPPPAAIPRHREHDFARGRRHDGARALARGLVVHRPDHDGRALRPAVDHAERQRGVQRDLETGRAADRLVRVQLSAADDGAARPASGCFPVWTPTCRITIHYADRSARAPATSTRCGRCRVPPAGVD